MSKELQPVTLMDAKSQGSSTDTGCIVIYNFPQLPTFPRIPCCSPGKKFCSPCYMRANSAYPSPLLAFRAAVSALTTPFPSEELAD